MHTPNLSRPINGTLRGALVAALFTLAACGDGPTVPQSMDPDEVARVMPSVRDARLRLTTGLLDASTRQLMRSEILMLETALSANDVPNARQCVENLGDALTNYRAATGVSAQDASDLTAIELMLYAVGPVVRNTRYDHRFKATP
jgi:hypothetical protein